MGTDYRASSKTEQYVTGGGVNRELPRKLYEAAAEVKQHTQRSHERYKQMIAYARWMMAIV